MKALKSFSSLLFIAAMAMLLAPLMQVSPVLIGGGLVMASFMMPKNVAFMAVTKEIWENDIIGNLFKDNQFAMRAISGDQYVINGKVVHIPVAGAPTRSKRNVTSFPLSAVKRADSEVIYGLDNYYQDPKHVEKVEQYELSYDKRQSVMGEQQSQLIQDAMDGLLYNWAWATPNAIGTTPANVVLTTGAGTATDILASATGQRKIFTKDVLANIKKKMDNANIPSIGRVALLTANHHQQLIDGFSDTALTNFYRSADLQKGIIGTYLGFTIMMRSNVQRWRKISTVWTPIDELDEAFAASAGDSAASLVWQESCVERARGDVNVFDNADRAEYYGSIFSMNMRLGGRQRRKEGVYAVIEDIVS